MSELTKTQTDLLGLASQALFGWKWQMSSPDYEALYQEAMEQTVLPLIYSVLSEKLPPDAAKKWRSANKMLLQQNIIVTYDHSELDEIMSKADPGIPYVVMKGVVSAKYYPDPMLRTMGDVDFLVAECDLQRAGALLEAAGFERTQDKEHGSHIAFHSGYSTWEMHWKPSGLPDGEAGKQLQEMCANMISSAQQISLFDGKFQAANHYHHCLIQLMHTATHLMNSGIGLRHLCDWAAFVNQIDVSQWKVQLQSCGLWRFAQILTALGTEYLHLPEQEWARAAAEQTLLCELISDVFSGGNFGKKDAQRLNQAKLMVNRDRSTVERGSMIRNLFSVANHKARSAMPACSKNVFLLPVGWGYITFRHLLRIQKGERPPLHWNEMLSGAEKRRDIYAKLRLFKTERDI